MKIFRRHEFYEVFTAPRTITTSRCVITDKYIKINHKKISIKKAKVIQFGCGFSVLTNNMYAEIAGTLAPIKILYTKKDSSRFLDAATMYNERVPIKSHIEALRLYESLLYYTQWNDKYNREDKLEYGKQLMDKFLEKYPVVPSKYTSHETFMKMMWIMQRESQVRRSEIDIATAMELYKKEVESDRRYRRKIYSSTGSSSTGGGSIVGDAAKIAVGVATIATAASKLDRSRKSNKKTDLWGTAMCPYGKPERLYRKDAPSFATIRCNISCPLWTRCGGHR